MNHRTASRSLFSLILRSDEVQLQEGTVNRKPLLLPLLALILLLLIGAACAGPQSTPATMPKAGETWRLVVLGDFQNFGFGEFYARQIEADLGVKVELDDLTSGGYTPANLLDDLRNSTGSRFGIRSAVKQANAVIFSVAPIGIIEEQVNGQLDCSAAALTSYKAALDSAYAEIFALRKGQPTLIRTKDYYCNFYSEWKEAGKYEDHMRCWETWNNIIHQAATEHKVPVAEVFAAFNGPSHEQDPKDKGLQDDNGLPTEAGNKLIADLLRKLGYDVVVP
jgi:hypothetical protein